MKFTLKRSAKLTLVCLTAALLFPLGTQADSSGSSPVAEPESKKVVARVNGAPIYEDQLNASVEARLGKYKRFGTMQVNDELKLQLQKEALEQIITSEVVYQESLKLDIPDVEDKVQKQVEAFKAHPLGKYKDKTDTQLAEMARRQIYGGEYLGKHNLLKPKVPEEDIKAYYEKNKQHHAAQQDSVRVRHILVQVPAEASEDELETARKKIEKARKQIVDGKDFGEVAKEFSEDNAASAGGDIGYVNRGYMPEEFEKVAFSIDYGKLSEVVKTKFGFHLLEVSDRIEKGRIPPYEDLKDFFGKFLQNQLSKKVMAEHIQSLRDKAKVEIYLE